MLAIEIDGKLEEQEITPKDKAKVEALGNYLVRVSIALEQAKTYKELRENIQKLNKKAEEYPQDELLLNGT